MSFSSRNVHVVSIGEDWHTVLLVRALRYVHPKNGRVYIVPKGLRSDYGSIPRLIWWWLPPQQYRPEYLLHDMLYGCQITTREEADRILLLALEEAGANWARRHIIYAGVRVGGWYAWNKATPDSIAACRKLRGDK